MSNATLTPVSVNLFGAFELRLAENSIHKWHAGKARNLFQYLLVCRGRLVLRERLYEVLWPESEWSPNSSSLKVAIHAVRQVLQIGPDGYAPSGLRIVHQDFGYTLYAEKIKVDVDDFEALIEAGNAATEAGKVADAMRFYRDAMDIYRDDFLAGERAEWITEQRQWYKSFALRILDRLSAYALRRADFDGLVHWCRRIIQLDPYRESAYRMLIEMHGRFGELGTVRHWYEICAQRMSDELGMKPAAETERVYRLAMRSIRTPAPRQGRVSAGQQ